jgi:outer membrane protein OmpU
LIKVKKFGIHAGLILTCGIAHAEGSVTLYGIADDGVTYVNNVGGHSVVMLQSGSIQGNRWGLLGKEDLGGGLTTIFQLENGFNLNTGTLGQGGAMFGRQAYVGISSNQFGTLSFGKQYDPENDYVSGFNISGDNSGNGAHLGDVDRVSGDTFVNTVKYASVNYSGFQFGGIYSFGNVPGAFKTNSSWDVAANYTHGPFAVGAAYTRLNKFTLTGVFNLLGLTSFLGQTTANVNLDSQQTGVVGASYQLGTLKLAGNYAYTQFKGFGETSHMNVYEFGGTNRFSPAFSGTLAGQYTTLEGHHWTQGTLGVDYHLSKRTDIYAVTDYMKASSGVNAVIAGNFTPSSTTTQYDFRIAMRHKF